jgi:ribosomal protein S12 methylthiotransferase
MRICIISLGCAKNSVDSECLAGDLKRAGHDIAPSPESADAAIVNTCGFIRPAVEESVSTILDLERMKLDGDLKKIGVVGCLVNRYGDELAAELPAVDIWARSEDWASVVRALGGSAPSGRVREMLPPRRKFTRYLKISEGCGNRCAYCTIPSIRGELRSLPVDAVVAEADSLVREGARELCVVGQDLTVYGTDLPGAPRLAGLLDELDRTLPKDVWIRLLYLHPARLSKDIIERAASGGRVLPYLDVPIQHADREILKAMNREMAPAKMREIFDFARSLNPMFALRTTCMVGFPGETRKSFSNLMKFIEDVRFDRMGAFIFHEEEGTPAASMENKVSKRTKERRLDRLMSLQEQVSLLRQELFVGKKLDVLIENIDRERGFAEGRSYREAPEVDGVIEIENPRSGLAEGDIIKVEIKDAMVHDMIGEEAVND